MIKFFEPGEIAELPNVHRNKLKGQKLDQVTEKYDNNYGNCILVCTHKSKYNRNIYIPGVIRAGLCYTMPLILPRCDDTIEELQAKDPNLVKAKLQIFNKLLYDYQQK